MSYDKRNNVQKYDISQLTLTGAASISFYGPKGKKGRLLDYGIEAITTTTAGATNTPQVKVGITGTLDAYGKVFDVGAVTAPGSNSVAHNYRPTDSTWSTYMANQDIAADTLITLTVVAATGGGAAGVGNPFCVVAWDD